MSKPAPGATIALGIFVGLLTAVLVCVPAGAGNQVSGSGGIPGDRQEGSGAPVAETHSAPVYGFAVVREYPHDPEAFTQGFLFADGYFYESTGLIGKSSLRQVDVETGKIVRLLALGGDLFGEGLALCKGVLVQLTWQSGIGFVYEQGTFRKTKEFKYAHEGWGITCGDGALIVSDGTSQLHFWDPSTFEEIRHVRVHDEDGEVDGLNELEFVKGEIFANIWGEDFVARISPRDGEILGWIDLAGLRAVLGPASTAEVLNGIAYDAERDRIFVTGKLWPKLFEIKITPPEEASAR